MDFDHMDDDFDLAPLIAHNAGLDMPLVDSPSPETSPMLEDLPRVQQRPISKRRGKKRSSRACASCRARKVRCNIVAHGAPCSNCRHDEVDCVLPLSRRQRAAKERAAQQQIQRQEQEESHNAPNTKESSKNPQWQTQSASSPIARTPLIAPHGMAISEHVLCEILPAHSASQRGSPIPQSMPLPPIPPKRRAHATHTTIEAPLATSQVLSFSRLPKVFAPLPDHLTSTDTSYLAARSAFTLPSEALQVAVLHAYVDFVHPSLPVVDIHDLLDTVKTGKGRKISLLLFQSIILAGIGFVSERILRSEYPELSKDMVISAMAGRVKLLYDFDTTTDRLTIIQSLLLLSHSLSQQPQPTYKNAHHYLGLALSLAFSLGIHRNQPVTLPANLTTTNLSPAISSLHMSALRRRKLERRTWWALYLQDKLLELSDHGKSRLKDEDFDAAALELSDFDLHDGNTNDEDDSGNLKEHVHAQTLVDKIKLARWGYAMCSRAVQPSSQTSPSQKPMPRQQRDEDRNQNPSSSNESENSAAPRSLSSSSHHSHNYAVSSSSDADYDQEMDCQTPREDNDFNDHRHNRLPLSLNPLHTQKHISLDEAGERELGKDCLVLDLSDSHDGRAEGGISNNDVGVTAGLGAGFGVEGEYDDYLEYFRA